MILFPNAKINIGLYVINRREDGYHNIESLFCPVGWCDILEINPSKDFRFISTGIKVIEDQSDNICVKAYNLLKSRYDIPAVSIHLHKIIPAGSGLGGGSSDAAFTLKGLNKFFNLGISEPELINLALILGSDCAFFIKNSACIVKGRGEKFEELEDIFFPYFVTIVYPSLIISTVDAYKNVNLHNKEILLSNKIKEPLKMWRSCIENDFEKSLSKKYPEIVKIKKKLYDIGAEYVSLSGSGSAIYALSFSEINTQDIFPNNYLLWHGRLIISEK